MTPRGVQVWFQNRRAKTKQQAKKAEAANAKSPSDPALAASSNPPIAPRPDADADVDIDDDADDADEPSSSALPSTPLPPHPSEDAAPDSLAVPDSAPASNANGNVSAPQDNEQQPNPTSDSRRPSIAHPHPRSGPWSASSPSPSTAPIPSSTAPSSTLSSPSPAGHVNSHVRLSTHPPAASSSYSHNHLAPTEIYSQRRTSLPPSLSSSLSGGIGARLGIGMLDRRRGAGYDPNARRRSTDLGGHRIVAHPYISVAQSANGPHHIYVDGEDGPVPLRIGRPMLAQRMSAPYASPSLHPHSAQAMPSPQGHHPHALSQPVLPSQAQHRLQHQHSLPQQPQQRQHYDISPIQVTVSHSQGYNQPSHALSPGYDLSATRHSIDGSALGLAQAHAHFNMGLSSLPAHPNSMDTDGFALGMGGGNYALSQRPVAPSIPGPLPSPNFSFGNPFGPPASTSSSSTSNSASGTPPNAASPPLLNMRRTSESGVSDADTEDSSRAPLSRFGSIASINESEGSWTSAYASDTGAPEGEDSGGDMCASRRMSCAPEFLGMFSDLDVGANGATPSPHEQQQQHPLRHATSASHLSPHAYPVQTHPHSPDALSAGQPHHMHTPPDADGYPSPSSASTVSAGSNGDHHQHTMTHDTTPAHTSGNVLQGQSHPRTNTSSELAYALQGEPAPTHPYHHPQPTMTDGSNTGELQYPIYGHQVAETGEPDAGGEPVQYGYTPEQAQAHYAKGQQLGHFPTVYEGYVYPHDGGVGAPIPAAGEMNQAYAEAGAIELSHMCVPASEFMGGYMQYS
ncbi:hypothetical protein C8Q78DRAFT_965431 [Trametes maxima]|nr:hypothetical protein C8Q78DRAFT_965431 [Trametes maxima]